MSQATPPDASATLHVREGLRSRDRHAVIAAVIVTLCLLGDAMLYLVLPANAEVFGLSAFWVGVALSVNRFIRLLLNQPVALVVQRFGLRAAMAGAVILSVLSTGAYGLVWGAAAFVAARVAWGAAFATMRLTSLGYATVDKSRSASRLGWIAGIKAVGPACALLLAGWAVATFGARELFVVLAALTVLGLPLVLTLPRPRAAAPVEPPRLRFQTPSATESIVFAVAFLVDGVLMAGVVLLLMGQGLEVAAAIQVGGVLLAGRYLSAILVGPAVGWTAQRWGFSAPFLALNAALVAGALLLGAGQVLWGAAVLIVFSSGLQALAPGIVAARNPGTEMVSLSFTATWRDLGAAVGAAAGPLIAVMPAAHSATFFGLSSGVLLGLLGWRALEEKV